MGLLPVACLLLGGFYLLLAVAHPFLFPASSKILMSLAALSSGLVLSLSGAMLQANFPEKTGPQALALALSLLPWSNCALALVLTQDAKQSTNFMLLVIGAGAFFLGRVYVLLFASWSMATWLALAWRHLPDARWVHYGFAVLSSTVVAILIQESRVRAAEEIFRLSEREFAWKLKRAQALRDLHHEINNPLQALSDAAYLIESGDLTVVPLLKDSLDRIRKVVRAMDGYIP
jgi:signal transduction histidine kinase